MPPIYYFAPYHCSKERTPLRQRQGYKNEVDEEQRSSNCFLRGLRFLYSGHRAEVETVENVFVIQNQYPSLDDVLKVKDV
jgi:hypothetical protein